MVASLLVITTGCGVKVVELTVDKDNYGSVMLDNGMQVLLNSDKTTSLTSACILIGGGLLTETAENNGVSNLMINMLLKGNDSLSAEEITERLAFLGATVSPNCYRDYCTLEITSLTENFEEVLDIVSKCLISPTFPEEELEKVRQLTEGAIKAANDDQSQASSNLFWKTAYGNEGYGLPTLGTLETIATLSPGDLQAYHEKYVGGRNMIFSIATDMPLDDLAILIQKKMGGVRAEADQPPAPSLTLQAQKDGFISFDRNQSFVYMGAVMDHLEAKDLACLALANETMGGGVGSRLWFLRQNEKLAYTVYSHYLTRKYSTVFRAAIGTDTSKIKTALASLHRDWDAMVNDGFTEEELVDARVNVKNSMIYKIDRKSGRCYNMAHYAYLGYGEKFVLDLINLVDQVTLEQVNAFVKTHCAEDKVYTSIVGKR